jgi:hypothetical protein
MSASKVIYLKKNKKSYSVQPVRNPYKFDMSRDTLSRFHFCLLLEALYKTLSSS